DQERVDLQALFEQSLKRRYKLIAHVSEFLSEIKDFDISKLKIIFTPNLPKSDQEKINDFKALGGELSNKTKMFVTGIVDDPDEEEDKIMQESQSGSLLAQKLEAQTRMSDKELAHGHAH
ncbi:phage portal protein, partial [Streptococcus agalactiae]